MGLKPLLTGGRRGGGGVERGFDSVDFSLLYIYFCFNYTEKLEILVKIELSTFSNLF